MRCCIYAPLRLTLWFRTLGAGDRFANTEVGGQGNPDTPRSREATTMQESVPLFYWRAWALARSAPEPCLHHGRPGVPSSDTRREMAGQPISSLKEDGCCLNALRTH